MGYVTYLFVCFFVSIWVHGGEEMDAGLSHQPNNALVAPLVLPAEVLHEVEDQFPAQDLVAMHPGHVAKLWFPCKIKKRKKWFGGLHVQPFLVTQPDFKFF